MENKVTHSPLPWTLKKTKGLGVAQILDAHGIMPVMHTEDPPDEDTYMEPWANANLELIVRAVNSFGPTKEALRAILALIDGDFDNPLLMKYGPILERKEHMIQAVAQSTLSLGEKGE